MVYARRDEPMMVVPSKGVFKWTLTRSHEEETACASGDVRAIASIANARALSILEDARRLATDTAETGSRRAQRQSPPCNPLLRAWRAACGPPKLRVVSCHNLGVNDLCKATPMTYRSVEELVGRIRKGWWIVVNDHHRGYKAMPLALRDRPYVCIWHPTRPGIVMMMTTLDFGLKNAPYFFSTFTAALLQQIIAWLGEDGFAIYYLDDNGVVCRADRVAPLLHELDSMAALAGYEYSPPKRQTGQVAKCLGRRYDSVSGELSVDPLKLFQTLVTLGLAAGAIDTAAAGSAPGIDIVDASFVQQLTGTLGWLAACSFAGQLYMGPFYYAAQLASRLSSPQLSRIDGFRAACGWWLERAASGRLRGHMSVPMSSIPLLRLAFDPTRAAVTRASGLGRGALTDDDNVETTALARRPDGGRVFCFQMDAGASAWCVIVGKFALWGRWRPHQRSWSSGGRELYGPLQPLLRLPELLRGASIVLGFDNASDTLAVGFGRARAEVERRLLAALFEAAQDLGAAVSVWWCSRRMNAGPDELSKITTPPDARRWCEARSLELIICDDCRDCYTIGSLSG